MRSSGSGSIMMPVEKGSISSGAQPNRDASALQLLRALAKPSAPVPALALPVLIKSARTPFPKARCSRQTCTGAAQNRLVVNTPATLTPSSSKTTVKSFRSSLRTPAWVTPMRTPAIGYSVIKSGKDKFTGIAPPYASLPWQCLYFFPLPHGQGSLRPTRGTCEPAVATALRAVAGSKVVSASPASVGPV